MTGQRRVSFQRKATRKVMGVEFGFALRVNSADPRCQASKSQLRMWSLHSVEQLPRSGERGYRRAWAASLVSECGVCHHIHSSPHSSHHHIRRHHIRRHHIQLDTRGRLTHGARVRDTFNHIHRCSGVQVQLECGMLLEGFRPTKIVRFYPASWPFITVPMEESFHGRE